MSEESNTSHVQTEPMEVHAPRPSSTVSVTDYEYQSPEDNKWFLSDGVEGDGETPDWFLKDKYKSVSEQARAYKEAQKILGGFSGAPDEYEVGLPENITQNVNVDALKEDPLFNSFSEYAKSVNMNQDTFNNLVSMYAENAMANAGVSDPEVVAQQEQEYISDQMKALGPDAEKKLEVLDNRGRNNLSDDQYQVFNSLANSAEAVELFLSLRDKFKSGTPSARESSHGARYSKQELSEMMADPRYLRSKPFREMVDQGFKELYG